MGLIYKPNALYMTPNRESVDVTNGVKLSFVFKGYQMHHAVGQLYTNTNIGEWSELGDPFTFASSAEAPYYNNQTITYETSSDTVYSNISGNAGSTLGWGVEVFGMPSTQTPTVANQFVPAVKGYETGNKVYAYNDSAMTTPHNYTFISDYDSKLTLDGGNTGVDAEGTDLTNTFTVTEGVYINLTTGDAVQENVAGTTYYVYKVNEGAADPIAYYIKFYDTQAHAEAGGETGVISGSTLAYKTFYVNPVTTTSNVFYVGVLGGNTIQLYTMKEAALQGVVEAIVPLTVGQSITIQIAENSQIVQWTPLLANSLVFDMTTIYAGQTVTLTQIASTTIYNYSYSGTLYTGQRLTAILSNDNKIDYYIRVWDDSTLSLYSTREAAVINNTSLVVLLDEYASVIYLTEILESRKEFGVTWNDPNNIPMITQWYISLYNVSQNDDGEIVSRTLVEQSDIQYTGNVQYTFNHLLLSCLSNLSGDYNDDLGRYEVVFNLTDNTGYEYEGSMVFDVGYGSIPTDYTPITRVNNCEGSVTIDWHNALSLKPFIVVTAGNNVTSQNDYIYTGNIGMHIDSGCSVEYGNIYGEINIPAGTMPTFLFKPDSNDFNGIIVRMDGDTQGMKLEYNNSTHKFILTIILHTWNDAEVEIEVDTEVTTLSAQKAYLIGYAEGQMYIREYTTV